MNNLQGSNLEELRRFMKMSQEEFATELGLSSSSISEFETGQRDINDQARAKLVDKFGVNLNWLSTGEGEAFDDRVRYWDIAGMYIRLGEEDRKNLYQTLSSELEK